MPYHTHMTARSVALSILTLVLLTCCVEPVFAGEATASAPPPVDVVQLVEHLLALLGTLAFLAGALATRLPKHWALTNWLARWGSDFRGVRPPAPELQARKSGGVSSVLVVMMAAALVLPGCAWFRSADWPKVAECAVNLGSLVGTVQRTLEHDDWGDRLEELRESEDSGAVLCAIKELAFGDTAAASAEPDTATVRARAFLREHPTEFR